MTENKMVPMKPHPDACQVCAREHAIAIDSAATND